MDFTSVNLDQLKAHLGTLSVFEVAKIEWRSRWLSEARPKQVIDFEKVPQDTIFIHAGRGWGKTKTLVNWICWDLCESPGMFGHVIAPTHNDIRYVIFEGESGILRQVPNCLIRYYNKTDSIIEFYNDSVLRGFSAEEAERLRGPQCARLALDEVAAWGDDRGTYEQAKFGHRLGKRSTCLIVSTPKPKELIKEFFKDKSILKIGGKMEENKDNLSPSFVRQMNVLQGTRLGRQELAGELLDAEELGVIKRSQWKAWPHDEPLPDFEILVMSLDTALSEQNVDVKKDRLGTKTDYTACSVWGGWRDPLTSDEKDALDQRKDLTEEERILMRRGQPNILLVDAWQERYGFPDLVSRVRKEKEKRYGLDALSPEITPIFGSRRMYGQGRKADLILIEDKNSGISLRQQLRREGIPTIPYNPGKADKLMRLNLVAPVFVSGYVHAPLSTVVQCEACGFAWSKRSSGAKKFCVKCGHTNTAEVKRIEFSTWAEPLIGQMCSYAGEYSIEHDDLMDSATQALLWLQRHWLRVSIPQQQQGKIRTRIGVNPYAA